MGLDLFEKIANTYERKARLYPALLMLVPIIVMVAGVYGVALELKAATIGLLASFGIFYLAASIVRELGKRIEGALFEEWGGKPTTQLLRHRDKSIDPVTKARYHAFLAKRMEVTFPSKADEQADAIGADDVYQSATKWLLDRTRDKKAFELLFEENIAFGFRRNCLGIKPFAIIISIITFMWPLFLGGVLSIHDLNITNISSLPNGTLASMGVSLFMLFIWVFFITKTTVRTAAFGYADFLLRACDALPKKDDL